MEATLWNVTGAVTEAGVRSPVPNARIEALDGQDAGMFATADAQGRYTLSGLRPGTFLIRAAADGLEPESRSIVLASGQTMDFALRRVVTPEPAPPTGRWALTGLVTDVVTQAVLASVRIEVLDGRNRGESAATDSQGRYRFDALDEDTFLIRATADQFESETASVTLASDTTRNLLLRRSAPPPPPGRILSGVVVDGLSDQGLSGVTIRIDGVGEATSTDDGRFSLAAGALEQDRAVTITGASTIDRVTRLRVPGPFPTITLMPKSINLDAFDQMFRGDGGELHRWTSAPRVVVLRRALQFTNTEAGEYTAATSMMSDADVTDLMADLTSALSQLTGGSFGGFAEALVEMAAEGEVVSTTRPGWIVVARYDGLTAKTSFWGYTRWGWNSAGEMDGANVLLDGVFEASTSAYRGSLHAHELGHALGYNHVNVRLSVMNASAQADVNAWDRDGARLAFLRRPLSQSPDVDPDPYTVNALRSRQLSWSGAP